MKKEHIYILKGDKFVKEPIDQQSRIELINDLCKLPGEQGLNERIFLANKEARAFEQVEVYQPDLIPYTQDWTTHWDNEKEKCYAGLLIDDFYIPGDLYWYLNYIMIPDKVKRTFAFPRIFDTDIWFFQKLELAELTYKFTATPKKRQIGVSLKLAAKILKRFWFEKGFVGKIVAYDEKYVKENWSLVENYSDHLNNKTPWYRPVIGGKLDWTQAQLLEDGTRIGLKSRLKGVTFNKNPAAVVSGKTDEIFADELGLAPNADEMLEFISPALQFGDITTGNFHGAGAVGRLKDCEPLKEWAFNPEASNFLSIPNHFASKPHEKVSLFIPEPWSYGSYMDEYGNSNVDAARKHIEAQAELEKLKSYKAYMIYRSQRPTTLEEAFAVREENIFPIDIIEPHAAKLETKYKPLVVELYESDRIRHKLGSSHPVVMDFPVTRKTNKHGAVVIEEAPLLNAPMGLYYAGVDTITPIKSGSISLQAIYIYKAAHQLNGEYQQEKFVAWYAGRAGDPDYYESYRICRDLIKYYNAKALIENNNNNFIQWMIKEKMQKYMMKRSEVAIGKDLILNSGVDRSDYGINVTRLKDYLIDLLLTYVGEEIETEFDKDGNPKKIFGIERIKDYMLCKEMLNYTPKKNVDRIDAACLALLAARNATSHGLIVTNQHQYGKSPKKSINYKRELQKSAFKQNTKISNPFHRW